jgi:hypothetical protein
MIQSIVCRVTNYSVGTQDLCVQSNPAIPSCISIRMESFYWTQFYWTGRKDLASLQKKILSSTSETSINDLSLQITPPKSLYFKSKFLIPKTYIKSSY